MPSEYNNNNNNRYNKNYYHNIRHGCSGRVDAPKRFIFVCQIRTRLQLDDDVGTERNLTVSNENRSLKSGSRIL